jgi:hypothetical protein
VAPLEMNAGTCWGKNTIGPRGRSVEKAPGSDFTFTLPLLWVAAILTSQLSRLTIFPLYFDCTVSTAVPTTVLGLTNVAH